jgi:predicted acylesterase/phospholipase RssA
MRLRWFNPAWTARALAEYLNGEFLNDINFAGVSERETRGDIPRLLINTTLYNDGRRLVFSTLPTEETQYDLIKDLAPTFTPSFQTDQHLEVMRSKWASLQTATPQALDVDQCQIRLAAAVAASMSFPPVIGPITFTVAGRDLYWHAGDGGLSDNAGIESLSMVMLN